MRVIVQRVNEASIELPEEDDVSGSIGPGLLLLVGLQQHDDEAALDWMANKLLTLRIFPDEAGKMNLAVTDVEGSGILLVPNFTVGCNVGKGRRPSFDRAMPPDAARDMFRLFAEKFAGKVCVELGVFGAHMRVASCNDGPVTFVIESPTS